MTPPFSPKSTLAKELGVALILKALLLCAIWLAFFSHPAVPSMVRGMDAAKVGAAIVGPARTGLDSNANQPSGEAR